MERFVQRLLQVSCDLRNQMAEIHKLRAGRIGASLFAVPLDYACGLLDSARWSRICLLFRTGILKSSIRLPDFKCAASQRGRFPRPDQVSEG
jgi:hypothetical protein